MDVEDERDILKDIAILRDRKTEIVKKLDEEINFGENFQERENIINEIRELELLIPSSGEQGMTGEGTIKFSRGPEVGRFRKKEQ